MDPVAALINRLELTLARQEKSVEVTKQQLAAAKAMQPKGK